MNNQHLNTFCRIGFSTWAIVALAMLGATAKTFADSLEIFPDNSVIDAGWQLIDASKIPDGGNMISSSNYHSSGWLKATVPGTVLTSLVNDGIYPEPLYGENNRPNVIPESLCRATYWYRTPFEVPASYAGRSVQLNFDGINYEAEVWVNGHDLGPIKGAFSRGIFDITSVVHRQSVNTLAVQILPQPNPGTPSEHVIGSWIHNGGVTATDGPTFLCCVGWDWIPGIRDRDMGIWQKVFLSAHGPVSVHDTDVTTDLPLPRLDSADLTVGTTLVNGSDQPQSGNLVGSFGDATFRYPMTLAANETRDVEIDPQTVPALHMVSPKLWWPNGYGPQNLYTLKLAFVENGVVSDIASTNFGVRKITYSVPGTDNLTLSVNGVKVFCKGGDWGMDEAMKREPYKRLDAQIRMHRDANYTMIRNWVGQSTSEDFYDLCDKYGILLWDEMFQPNPHDGPNPADFNLYEANVKEKILRFRSHPCIALWCGRNEGYPPPDIDAANRQVAQQLDPQRLYQPSSAAGHGVNSHGPYRWRTPREYYSYNEAFKTEIGSMSIPTLESVESFMPQKDWNTIDNDWAEHDFTSSAGGGDRYPTILAARYGHIRSLADFCRKGQMGNYEAYRAMYEGREAKLFTPETGCLTWMSNPAQPSFVWQLYSWDLEPNSSEFAAKKACEPVHIQMNQDDWHLMIINNTPTSLSNLSAKVSIYNIDGSLQSTHTDTITAAPSAATDDGLVSFPATVSPVHFVKLELREANGNLLSDNFYWRETQQDDFTAMDSMPTAALTGDVVRHETATDTLLTVTLKNYTNIPAIMAHLQLRNAVTRKRVLPVFYSDNYVSLMPGESKTITVDAAKTDLDGDAPLVLVDGWNVTVKPAAGILPNLEAIVEPATTAVAAVAPAADTVRINCGGSDAGQFFTFGPMTPSAGFQGDTDYSGGSTSSYGSPINVAAAYAAPQGIYQSERWGESTYTIPVVKEKTYTVRLHFAENTFNAASARLFNVDINGNRVLSNFDIFATAGGKDIAVVKEFTGIQPDADGNIIIHFAPGTVNDPTICGIEVIPK